MDAHGRAGPGGLGGALIATGLAAGGVPGLIIAGFGIDQGATGLVKSSTGQPQQTLLMQLVTAVGSALGFSSPVEQADLATMAAMVQGGGSGLRTPQQAGISPADTRRIQNAANRTQQSIIVIGSRAQGNAGPTSDWDYILSGRRSSQRHSARSSLPRGTHGGEINATGRETGIDLFQDANPQAPGYNPVRPDLPHVIFVPQR